MSAGTDTLHPSIAPARDEHPVRARWTKRLFSIAKWAVALVVIAGLVFAVVRYRSTHAAPAVRYETAKVDRGPIAAKVTATGTVSALVTVLVGSQVSGRIDKLFADFESPVKQGQTIATIEPSLFRAAVAQARANDAAAVASVEKAEAQLALAKKSYIRANALFAQNVGSKSEVDTAEADLGVAQAQLVAARATVEQAKAALEQANLNLRYTTISSPIDGVVISRNVDVGQTVAAALQAPTLFTIAQDLTRMQVDTNVAEADVGKVKAGMPVTFTVDAYPQRSFDGMVRQVRDNAQTLQNVVTYDAVIDTSNVDRTLKPGMTASVTFVYATRDSAVRLPNGALRFKADPPTLALMTASGVHAQTGALKTDERAVWVLRDGQAVQARVKIGISDGSTTEVLDDGVREGDTVIVEAIATGAPGK